MFLGGWSGPGVACLTAPGMALGWQILGNTLGIIYFVSKAYLLCFVFIWVRRTLPRLRADQLTHGAWVILIPTTLGNVLFTALLFLGLNRAGLPDCALLIVLCVLDWL